MDVRALRFTMHESVTLSDLTGDGRADVATLRTKPNAVQVVLHDVTRSQPLRTLHFDAAFKPVRLLWGLNDFNGNGAPEVALLTRNPATRAQRVEIKDASTKATISVIGIPAAFVVQDAVRVPDLSGNGSDEVAVVGKRPADGRLNVFVNEPKTGKLIKRIWL
jgi:hypothetical protein